MAFLTRLLPVFACGPLLRGAALTARAQNGTGLPASPKFYLGLRAGYSSYSLSGREVELITQPGGDKLLRVPWLTAGLVARWPVLGPLAVQVEADYVRQGGDFTRQAFPGNTDYTVDCLHLPLLLNVRLPLERHLALHVEGGLAGVFVVRNVVLDTRSFAPGNSFDNQSAWLASAVGGELAWHAGPRLYYLNARYTQDLTDYYRRRYSTIDFNARSFGFTLTLGVLLGDLGGGKAKRQSY